MESASDAPPSEEIQPEPAPAELWEGLPADDQRRAVRLLAQIIYKAILADRNDTPTD